MERRQGNGEKGEEGRYKRVGAHIVSQQVQGAIVAPRLLIQSVKEIVLGDEVTSARMQASSHHARDQQIPQRVPSCESNDCDIERELSEEIQADPLGRCLVLDESRSQRVEEYLECAV